MLRKAGDVRYEAMPPRRAVKARSVAEADTVFATVPVVAGEVIDAPAAEELEHDLPRLQLPPAPWPQLVPIGRLAGKPSFRLTRPVALVGSRRSAHLHLQSHDISNAHAIILNAEGKVYVRDLVSRSGVRINGRPVREAYFEDGDQVAFGHFLFQFQAATGMRQRPVEDTTAPALLDVDGGPFPLPVEGRVMVIGRRPRCDVVLAEEACSIAHAVIYTLSGKRFVRDLGSRTGTFLNGRWIKQEELHFGDEVRVGETNLRYVAAGGRALPPAPSTVPSTQPRDGDTHVCESESRASEAVELEDTPIVTAITSQPPPPVPATWVVCDGQLLADLASAAQIAGELSVPPCSPDRLIVAPEVLNPTPSEATACGAASITGPVESVESTSHPEATPAKPVAPLERVFGQKTQDQAVQLWPSVEVNLAPGKADRAEEPVRPPRMDEEGDRPRRSRHGAGGWFGLGKRRRVKSRAPLVADASAPPSDATPDEELPLWDFADGGSDAASPQDGSREEPAMPDKLAAAAPVERAMATGDEFVRLDLEALPAINGDSAATASPEPRRTRSRSRRR